MADGHLNKCKDCTKLESKTRFDKLIQNEDFADTERTRQRDKYYRLGYKDVHKPSPIEKRAHTEAYKAKHPEKIRAIRLAQGIVRPNGMEGHHWSYNESDAKDLVFLSKRNHALLHRYMVYDHSLMMYRRKDNGELLASAMSHISLLSEINYCESIKTA